MFVVHNHHYLNANTCHTWICHWYFSAAVPALPLQNLYTMCISTFSSVTDVKDIIISTKCTQYLRQKYSVTEPLWTERCYVQCCKPLTDSLCSKACSCFRQTFWIFFLCALLLNSAYFSFTLKVLWIVKFKTGFSDLT